jgi:hypothetical protein
MMGDGNKREHTINNCIQIKKLKTSNDSKDILRVLNDLWKSEGIDMNENNRPPFNDWGEMIFQDEIKEIDDPDIIFMIYEKAFINWNKKMMEDLCTNLLFVMQEDASLADNINGFINVKNKGDIIAFYMDASRSSTRIANITRKLIFPPFRHLLFSELKTWDKVKKELVDWGSGFNNSENKNKLWKCPLGFQYTSNINEHSKSTLKDYKKNGTIMHIGAGTSILKDVILAYGLESFNAFIPGRIVSLKLPFLASTPDFCISLSEEKFKTVYAELINNMFISESMKPYVPHMWVEIKTIQKEDGIIKKIQLQKLYYLIANLFVAQDSNKNGNTLSEVLGVDDWNEDLYYGNDLLQEDKAKLLNECKKEAVVILSNLFKKISWMPNEQKSKKSALQLLMQRQTKIVPTSIITKCNDRWVSTKQLKHLFSKETDMLTYVPISPMIQAGRAWIFVYGKCGNVDKCLLQLSYDQAPFLLGPVSDFYTQVVEQICCVQYINGIAVHLFIIIIKHSSNSIHDDINRPCFAYVYEVIVPNCIRTQYEKQCFFKANKLLGFNTPIIHAGQNILDNLMWNDNDYDKSMCALEVTKDFINQKGNGEVNNAFHDLLFHKFDINN